MSRILRVLLVDDEEYVVDALKLLLERAMLCQVFTANSGKAALRLAQSQKPDVILLDVMMPGMNGYTVGSSIRSDPRTQHIPILVVSGLREINRLVAGTFPADCFLNKPFTPDELIGKVAMVLDKRQAQA